MKITSKNIKEHKKLLVELLKKDSNAILAAIKLMAPKDTGLMASGLKLIIKETAQGVGIIVLGSEQSKTRIKNGRSEKPRAYFFPSNNINYMGPRSIYRTGQRDRKGKTIKPFIEVPIQRGVERALDILLSKYNIRMEVGWDA